MTILVPALAVAFVAVCVWLTVRVVNRRERRAKWTLAVLIGLPVVYVLSFGPVCWITTRPRLRDFPPQVHWATRIFWPVGRVLGDESQAMAAIRWWSLLGVPDGYVILVPQTPEGTTRFALKKGGGGIN
jgi:hypothetical protein